MSVSYQYRVVCCFAAIFVLALTGGRLEAQQPVYNPANGHYYEGVDLFFPPMGVEWPEANDIAAAATFTALEGPLTGQLLRGHLVTITSAEEQAFLEASILPLGAPFADYWLGGVQPLGQAAPDVGWQWVTGEENEPWGPYINWGPGEPNDGHADGLEKGRAQYLELRAPPGNTTWVDNGVRRKSYIIEYDDIFEVVLPETECSDKMDNDGDGSIDCEDTDCLDPPNKVAIEPCGGTEGPEECDDGQDNDLDGLIDCDDAVDCDGDPTCPRGPPFGFVVDFTGRPNPPFIHHIEFLWDEPEPGLATTRTNQGAENPVQQQLNLSTGFAIQRDFSRTWDPAVAGSYEVNCMVVSYTAGVGTAVLEFMGNPATANYTWTITWTEFLVAFDSQWLQYVDQNDLSYTFEMDTTDDFHCYRVEWDPSRPHAELFVDDESTGLTLDVDLSGSRGRTDLVLGDAFSGSVGGEMIFDSYSFTPRVEETVCDDLEDNDGDGDIDCDDADCADDEICQGEGPFLRGDCDGNGTVGGTPTEAVIGLNHTFRGGPVPPCLAACDAEANGTLGITDYVRILRFSFAGGQPPDAPFPDCVTSTLETDLALGCETPFCSP